VIALRQAPLARAVTRPWPSGDDPVLAGFDPAGLALLARLTVAKRLEKIALALPVTARLLGLRFEDVGSAFVAASPPADPTRLAGATAFVAFLAAMPENGLPPWLLDTAEFELAFLLARLQGDDRPAPTPSGTAVRRRPATVLRAFDWDVLPLFGAGAPPGSVERAPLFVASVGNAREATPRVYALVPEVFALAASLDDWQPVETLPTARVEALVRRGILEVR